MCEMYKADMYLRPFFFNLSTSRKYHVHDRARFTYDRQSAFVHYSEQIYTKRLIGSRRSGCVGNDKTELQILFSRLKQVARTRHLLPDLKILSRGPRVLIEFAHLQSGLPWGQ